ncbi:hypothetical protein V6Z11_A03G212100 [Gossypium hirsutum]
MTPFWRLKPGPKTTSFAKTPWKGFFKLVLHIFITSDTKAMGRGWYKAEQRWSGLGARSGRCARGTWGSCGAGEGNPRVPPKMLSFRAGLRVCKIE